MCRAKRQSAAFTLMELLLAMGMISMLSLSLYACMRIAFRARGSAVRAVEPARAVSVALDLIGRDLESALPPTGVLAESFLGQHEGAGDLLASTSTQGFDTLQFYCVGEGPYQPDPTGQGGMRRVELGVSTLSDGKTAALVRRSTTNLLAQVEPEPQQEVLCRGVKAFSLRYYDGTTWQTDWDSSAQNNTVPAAVEVTLQIQWPADSATPETTCTMTRVFPLACHEDATTAAAAGGAS